MEKLRKRIGDKKLLKLIKDGRDQTIIIDKKRMKNLIGMPQGSMLSSLLFNIYA